MVIRRNQGVPFRQETKRPRRPNSDKSPDDLGWRVFFFFRFSWRGVVYPSWSCDVVGTIWQIADVSSMVLAESITIPTTKKARDDDEFSFFLIRFSSHSTYNPDAVVYPKITWRGWYGRFMESLQTFSEKILSRVPMTLHSELNGVLRKRFSAFINPDEFRKL